MFAPPKAFCFLSQKNWIFVQFRENLCLFYNDLYSRWIQITWDFKNFYQNWSIGFKISKFLLFEIFSGPRAKFNLMWMPSPGFAQSRKFCPIWTRIWRISNLLPENHPKFLRIFFKILVMRANFGDFGILVSTSKFWKKFVTRCYAHIGTNFGKFWLSNFGEIAKLW